MYLMTKGSEGSDQYLTKSEQQLLQKNNDGLEAYCEQHQIKKDTFALEKYLNDDATHQKAVFSGGLAKRLNLNYDQNGSKIFQALINGDNPLTPEEFSQKIPNVKLKTDGRLTNYSSKAKQGEHIILAMPKSFSMMYAISTPESQKLLRQCVIDADQEVMKQLASVIKPADSKYILQSDWEKLEPEAQAKYGDDRIVLNNETEIVSADFHHYSDRPDEFGQIDPHYHMHKQLMPTVLYKLKNGEEKIMGFDNKKLYNEQKLLTSNFSTLVANNLEKIGVAIEDDRANGNGHTFRISGIERETELDLSKRKRDIESVIEGDTQKMMSSVRQELAMAKRLYQKKSRNQKLDMNATEEHTAIEKRTLDLLGEKGLHNLEVAQQDTKMKILTDQFDLSTINDLANTGEMSEANIKAELGNVLRFSGKKYNTIKEINNDIDDFYNHLIEKKMLIKKENGMITHIAVINDEHIAVNSAKKLLNETNPDTAKKAENTNFLEKWNEALPENRKLFEGQRQACQLVANEEKLILIEGLAGSAKTTSVAKFAYDLWSQDPNTKIIGLSTQTKTAKSLGEVGFKDTSNMEKFCRTYFDFEKNQWKEEAIKQASGQKIRVLLDEGGMVSAKHHKVLFELATKLPDMKIVEIGHTAQLASVGAGNVYTHLVYELNKLPDGGGRTATLNKVVRHLNEETLGVATAMLDKAPEQAFEIMKGKGWLHNEEVKDRDALIDKIAEQYVNDPDKDKVCMVFTNEDGNRLNDAIRTKTIEQQDIRRAEAKAKGIDYDASNDIDSQNQILVNVFNKGQRNKSKEFTERYFAKGDKIVITDQLPEVKFNPKSKQYEVLKDENGKRQVIANAEDGLIKAIEKDPHHPDHHIIKIEINGQEKQIHTAFADHRCFTHSAARTTHQSQGLTVDSAYVLAGGQINANMAYVQFSRSRHKVQVFIDPKDEQKWLEQAKRGQIKASTLEDKNCLEAFNSLDKSMATDYLIDRTGKPIEIQPTAQQITTDRINAKIDAMAEKAYVVGDFYNEAITELKAKWQADFEAKKLKEQQQAAEAKAKLERDWKLSKEEVDRNYYQAKGAEKEYWKPIRDAKLEEAMKARGIKTGKAKTITKQVMGADGKMKTITKEEIDWA